MSRFTVSGGTGARGHEGTLYGRSDLLTQICRSTAPVLVVAGDPGVGKTELSVHAARATSALAPEPAAIAYRPGALQMALLSALASALADHIAVQRRTDRVAGLFSEAAQRVGKVRLKPMAAAAAQFMVGVARDKLGDTAVDLATDFVQAVNVTLDEQLIRRVTQAADPDVVDVFKALASEACELVDGPIVLTLDAVEKLHEDDFAQLRDLVSSPPDGLRLRLVHATPEDISAQRVRDLRIAGAEELEVSPIDRAAVYDWLAREGLTEPRIEEIARTTLGYPLYITAAIEHVRQGGSISDLRGARGFVAQMTNNFQRLGRDEQRACILLAAFTDPPSVEQITATLTCVLDDWLVLEGRLVERRILPTKVNGSWWFHELGRRAIWDEAMSDAQREYSAERAVETILASVTEHEKNSVQEAVDVARLLPHAPGLVRKHEGVPDCLQFSLDKLAVYAALMELTEAQEPSLDAYAVVAHARQAFDRRGNLETALRALRDDGLIGLAENRHAAVVVGAWPSLAVRLLVQGRSTLEFGRVPVPAVASATFDHLVRPIIGPFVRAAYGVGNAGLVRQSSTLHELDADRDSIHKGLGIMARAQWGGVALYYAILFSDVETRDFALSKVHGLKIPNYLGSTFHMVSVHPWPHNEPLPARRYIDAAEWCSPDRRSFRDVIIHDRPLAPPPQNLKEDLELRLATRRLIASMADPFEREVLELDNALGYVYFDGEDGHFVAHVTGLDEVCELPVLDEPFAPFGRARIAAAAGLSPAQHIGTMTLRGRGRPNDPVAEVLDETYKALKEFNSRQRHAKRFVKLDSESLRQAILDALNERTRIAGTMLDAGLIASPDRSQLGAALRVLVQPAPEREGWVTGAHGTLSWTRRPAEKNEVDLVIADVVNDPRSSDSDVHEWLGFDKDGSFNRTYSDLIHGLARLLGGYDDGAIRLVAPDKEQTTL